MMEISTTLFGSPVKAKLMRLFLFNPHSSFGTKTIAKKIRASEKSVRKELSLLLRGDMIKKKIAVDDNGRKVKGYALNERFPYRDTLAEFLLAISPLSDDALVKEIGRAAKPHLIVVSGAFLNSPESRADLLVVSDRTDEKKWKDLVQDFEAEAGRELSYVVLSKEDFSYRLGMGDKLIRDIFDFRHKVIFDKIGFTEE